MYKILHTKQALKDSQSVKHAGLGSKVKEIEITVEKDPFEKSQGFERLTRDLKGACSRRINYKAGGGFNTGEPPPCLSRRSRGFLLFL